MSYNTHREFHSRPGRHAHNVIEENVDEVSVFRKDMSTSTSSPGSLSSEDSSGAFVLSLVGSRGWFWNLFYSWFWFWRNWVCHFLSFRCRQLSPPVVLERQYELIFFRFKCRFCGLCFAFPFPFPPVTIPLLLLLVFSAPWVPLSTSSSARPSAPSNSLTPAFETCVTPMISAVSYSWLRITL